MPKANKQAEAFVNRWKGRGNEDSDTQQFWNDLLQNVMGVASEELPAFVDYEHKVRGVAPNGKVHTRRADGYIASHGVLIEQKSITESLDKKRDNGIWGFESSLEQAMWYCHHMPKKQQPTWIITCNFATFRIYNLDQELPERHPQELSLEELPRHMNLFSFIRSEESSRIYCEQKLSYEAGRVIGRLYGLLANAYHDIDNNITEKHSLNTIITRIVFLLYSEDAALLDYGAFSNRCRGAVGELKHKLEDMFVVLDTPLEKRASLYVDESVSGWPYLGGPFHDNEGSKTIVPWLSDEAIVETIEEAAQFDWSDLNPSIFGAVFESILSPSNDKENKQLKLNRTLHYTSIKNIHKVIDPLFLDDLLAKFEEAKDEPMAKLRIARLRKLHSMISSIKVLDPCCGSGNFLTESYISLRRLENRVLMLLAESNALPLGEEEQPIRVNLGNFYGVEIDDLASMIAATALWISEQQMIDETANILPEYCLRIVSNSQPMGPIRTIVTANALSIDWDSIVSSHSCSFVIGNPPFRGGKKRLANEKAELESLYGSAGEKDYCSAWFMKTAKYMTSGCRAAFIATDSICQGAQVGPIWQPINSLGIHIDFAHRTFRWNSNSPKKSSVYCIVVGFSREDTEKALFLYDTPDSEPERVPASHINGYLMDASDFYVSAEPGSPLSDVPEMRSGNKPDPTTPFVFKTAEEKDAFVLNEPLSIEYIHPYKGGDEFLNGTTRWILKLCGITDTQLSHMPLCRQRLDQVRRMRLKSSDAGTRRLADKPADYHVMVFPTSPSLVVPETSSESRVYIPMGFIGPETVCSNQLKLIPGADYYHFGVMQSKFHLVWINAVGGKHEGRPRYSIEIIYNSFVWPNPGDDQREAIVTAARAVMEERARYQQLLQLNLATLYKPDKLPTGLRDKHLLLDEAVESAYGVSFNGDEHLILEHLIHLYKERKGLSSLDEL